MGFGTFSLGGLLDLKEKDGFEDLPFGADLGAVFLGLDLPRGVFLEAEEEVGNKKRRQPLDTSTDIDEDEEEQVLLPQSMPLRSLNGLLGLFLFFVLFFSFLLFDDDDDNCRFNITAKTVATIEQKSSERRVQLLSLI